MQKLMIPRNDDPLAHWAKNFAVKAAINPTGVGLTASIVEDFGLIVDHYVAALARANDPDTKGPKATFLKNQVKEAIYDKSRQFAKVVENFPGVSDEVKQSMGLPTGRTPPRPTPVPSEAPLIQCLGSNGTDVVVSLIDAEEGKVRRAKPEGVAGMSIFSAVSETAPVGEAGWTFRFNTTQTRFVLPFDATLAPGTRVWVLAFYYNRRGQSGPAARPVGVNLPGGGAGFRPAKAA